MHADQITPDELRRIAWILVERHGKLAVEMTAEAIAEIQQLGDDRRTLAWMALHSVIADALSGHIHKNRAITLH